MPPRSRRGASKSEGANVVTTTTTTTTKRTRQTLPAEGPKPKKRRDRRWTTAEVPTAATATGAEVCVAEALGAIDAQLVAGCRDLRRRGLDETSSPWKAIERFAEVARREVAAMSHESSAVVAVPSSEDALAVALDRQLDKERAAEADLERLEKEDWSSEETTDTGARVREALDLKSIAGARLADRAGALNHALAKAKAAQADLYNAFHGNSRPPDPRRLIRTFPLFSLTFFYRSGYE